MLLVVSVFTPRFCNTRSESLQDRLPKRLVCLRVSRTRWLDAAQSSVATKGQRLGRSSLRSNQRIEIAPPNKPALIVFSTNPLGDPIVLINDQQGRKRFDITLRVFEKCVIMIYKVMKMRKRTGTSLTTIPLNSSWVNSLTTQETEKLGSLWMSPLTRTTFPTSNFSTASS
jgi:hypothetical protein